MPAGITYYHALPVTLPVARVLLRLGYKKASGPPPDDVLRTIDRFAAKLRVQGAFLRVPIVRTQAPKDVFLGDGTTLSSVGLFDLLGGCAEAAFLASSAPDAPALVAERFVANAAD